MAYGNPNNINFSFEYALSIIVVLIVCNVLLKKAPQMNSALVIIVGLFVGYLTLLIMNNIFPHLNQFGSNIYQYYQFQFMNNFSNMGYLQIWPPILAILIIFVVLLYNKQLG